MREPSLRRAQDRAREREEGGGEESGKLRKRVPVGPKASGGRAAERPARGASEEC